MDNNIKTWLKDIDQAIAEIKSFIPEIKDFKEFQKDLKTRRAVERNVEIIGEAMSRILAIDPKIKISHTRKIVDTRNRIIHGYDSVSADILWGIIIKNLPDLEKEIKSLLS
ncbi:MAG: HepT-like ribonuclease domain-containing protein [Cytophagales bacterium]|nr:HepT-like ribonuclease domain-containing protein [Cytophagales bacterium]